MTLTTAGHDEWLVDEAIDDTFPASDPVAPSVPGSIVNMRYLARERRTRRQRHVAAPLAIGAAAVAACVTALLLARR